MSLENSNEEESSSSSDSDIESYLQPIDKIDLSSSFFDITSKKIVEVSNEIPKKSNLNNEEYHEEAAVAEKIFKNMEDYRQQMEQAKKHIEEYNLKNKNNREETDTFKLLAMKENGVDFHITSKFSDSESELEEVSQDEKDTKKPTAENLEINVEMPEHIKHKTGQELLDSIKRRINNIRKKNQVLIHKVHLLCWLAYGFGVTMQINSSEIQNRALSLIPSKLYTPNKITLIFLRELLKWYQHNFTIFKTAYPQKVTVRTLLHAQMDLSKAFDARMLVYIFAAILKSLGVDCRLILNIVAEPLKPAKNQLHSLRKKDVEKEKVVATKASSKRISDCESPSKKAKVTIATNNNEIVLKEEKSFYSLRSRVSPKDKIPSVKRAITQLDGPNDSEDEVFVRRVSPRLAQKSENQKLKLTTSKSQTHMALADHDDKVVNVNQRRSLRLSKSLANNNSPQPKVSTKRKASYIMTPKTSRNKNNRRIEMEPKINKEATKKPHNIEETLVAWIEVFLKKENQWVTIDVINGNVDCFDKLTERISDHLPLATYLLAFHNKTVKDLTQKYSSHFNTALRKLRVNAKWWETTLKPYKPRQTKIEKKEDEELERKQLEQPLPTYIAQYKNHPLYVLKRHLLKYEAIYPPTAPIVGFVRKEEVYSRECVYKLHPRDIWYKQAKVVKPGEKAYKIVKGRPRWDKLSRQIVTDPTEEVFGPWQVEDYDPPTAENGIVPRNSYGNVELFKPSMLPKKTVHLQLPGLNKIAKQMNIDCASAIVGFDYTNGWVHPSYDGFVVCEEFEEMLVAAWELNEDELDRQEEEKIEKRVYGNWKKLIKGLLIRQRLNAKYQFGKSIEDFQK